MLAFIENKVTYKYTYRHSHSYRRNEGFLSSRERVPDGTIRMIVNRLFYATNYLNFTDWTLVKGEKTEEESFLEEIIDSTRTIILGEFLVGKYDIEAKIKAKRGDILAINGNMMQCTSGWTNFPFFSYGSLWEMYYDKFTIMDLRKELICLDKKSGT